MLWKFHETSFCTACSGMYFESLNGMSLILILLEMSFPFRCLVKILPRFQKYLLSLMAGSELWMQLSEPSLKYILGSLDGCIKYSTSLRVLTSTNSRKWIAPYIFMLYIFYWAKTVFKVQNHKLCNMR